MKAKKGREVEDDGRGWRRKEKREARWQTGKKKVEKEKKATISLPALIFSLQAPSGASYEQGLNTIKHRVSRRDLERRLLVHFSSDVERSLVR